MEEEEGEAVEKEICGAAEGRDGVEKEIVAEGSTPNLPDGGIGRYPGGAEGA